LNGSAAPLVERKRRFLLLLSAVILVGMLGTTLLSFLVSRASIRDELAGSTLPLVGDTIYSEIQRDLLRPVFISSLMASNTFVHDWTLSGEQDPLRMVRYLEEVRTLSGAFTAFFVSDRTRRYYAADGVLKRVADTEPRDEWFFRVRRMNEPFEINVDPDLANGDALAVFVNYRVLDAGGDFLGAIGVGLSIDTLNRLIDSYGETYRRVVSFVDPQGEIRLGRADDADTRNLRQIDGLEALAERLAEVPYETALSYETAEGETLVDVRFIEELGWYLIVEQRVATVLGAVNRTFALNLAASVLIAAIVLLIAHRVLFLYHRDLEQSATTDPLTGTLNRAAFETIALRAFERTGPRRGGRRSDTLSMLFIDIDHFKRINDTYGHVVGDAAIRHCASTVAQALREQDTLCRWGGEEFCVLLEGCTASEAEAAGAHVRTAVEAAPLHDGGTSVSMTVSIGVGELHAGESLDRFLGRVDRALYAAKESGRNRVQLAGEEAFVRE